MATDPNKKDPKKKVYGNPVYGKDQDITNQGNRIPITDLKRDGTEPDIKKLYNI